MFSSSLILQVRLGKHLWLWDYAVPNGGKKKEYRHTPPSIDQEEQGVNFTYRTLEKAGAQSQTEKERSII